MFAKTEVKDLFPTPLWIVDLTPAKRDALNRQLMAAIEALMTPRRPQPIGVPWQTEPTLQNRPEFAEFCDLARSASKAALDFLGVRHDGFDITGCWANIHPAGTVNSRHHHPNNYLSGVYYVAIPDGTGKIEFSDPRTRANMIQPPVQKFNKYAGDRIILDVQEGRFILFPAWLDHAVPMNRSNGERVSIAFNVMFRQFSETMARPLWSGAASVKA